MIKLFIDFLIIGLLSIGGAYVSIPLVRLMTADYGITSDMFLNFVAISESTPGPIAVNLATFIGAEKFGLTGALVATFAEVLPAFLIILLYSVYSDKLLKNKIVSNIFSIIRPIVYLVILVAGFKMLYQNVNDLKSLITAALIVSIIFVYKFIRTKRIGTIFLIVLAGIVGIVINMFF